MSTIQNPRHPYHNLLRNVDDMAVIMQQSNYGIADYERLFIILQERMIQRRQGIYRQRLFERSQENITCENHRLAQASIEELQDFMKNLSIVDISSSQSSITPSTTTVIQSTPTKHSISIPFNPATSIHSIAPPLPISHSAHSLTAVQSTPSLTTSETSNTSYRIIFEHYYYRISLTYSFITVLGRRHHQQMILIGPIDMGPDQPEETIRERSVDIKGLHRVLGFRFVTALDLSELITAWFTIFDDIEAVIFE